VDKLLSGILVVLVLSAGCLSSVSDQDSHQRARQHMAMARVLESDSRWNEAAMEYSIVAEHYSKTEFYDIAVRKAALLFSRIDNPLREDSIAVHWLAMYAELPLSDAERLSLQLHVRMLGELDTLRMLLSHEIAAKDSLSEVTRRQQEEIVATSIRIHELEQQLASLSEELEKLREIDLKFRRGEGEERR